MGPKLSAPDKELYRRIDGVLHYIWDPIGVSGVPMAKDGHYNYLPQIFSLLKADADAERIAAYLFEIVTENMGLNGNRENAMQIVNILLDWRQVIREKRS